jgi:AP-4 complex subunit beta-1
VKELKGLLKSVITSNDIQKRRDVIKKVIAFSTLGIDVSELFAEMCLASYSSDLI